MNKLDLIFEEWKASLRDRDRSMPSVEGNFEELFESLQNEEATPEQARVYLDKAIKAHQPPSSLVRNMYKRLKASKAIDLSEKEFSDNWNQSIADKGNSAFFTVYPVAKTPKKVDVEEPIIFGSMTIKEYKTQRSYADQFPRLNTDELERRMRQDAYDPEKDIAAILGKVSSGSNK